MMLLRGEECEESVRRMIGTGEGSARERFRWEVSGQPTARLMAIS